MKAISVVVLLVLVVVSCSKDKFESRPRLTFKELRGNYIPVDGAYSSQFVLEYTDAEGDLAGVPVFFEKISSSAPCASSSINPNLPPDSVYLVVSPNLPPSANQKGEITILLQRSQMNPVACGVLDTLEEATFKFWIKDLAGNISDTVTAPPIRIEKTP